MKIVIHIERLNLAGVNLTPAERRSLAGSLESELSRLVAAGGIAPAMMSGASLPGVPVPPVELAHKFTGAQAGVEIAHALYAGFGNPAAEGDGQ
jgi:hypothetical protein